MSTVRSRASDALDRAKDAHRRALASERWALLSDTTRSLEAEAWTEIEEAHNTLLFETDRPTIEERTVVAFELNALLNFAATYPLRIGGIDPKALRAAIEKRVALIIANDAPERGVEGLELCGYFGPAADAPSHHKGCEREAGHDGPHIFTRPL